MSLPQLVCSSAFGHCYFLMSRQKSGRPYIALFPIALEDSDSLRSSWWPRSRPRMQRKAREALTAACFHSTYRKLSRPKISAIKRIEERGYCPTSLSRITASTNRSLSLFKWDHPYETPCFSALSLIVRLGSLADFLTRCRRPRRSRVCLASCPVRTPTQTCRSAHCLAVASGSIGPACRFCPFLGDSACYASRRKPWHH